MAVKKKSQPHTIVVTVEGGVVQDISGIPKGTRVVVHDYDADGTMSKLQTDDRGDAYFEGVWECDK